MVGIFMEVTEPLNAIAGSVCLVFQPLSVSTMKLASSNGGNAMGLDEKDGPLTGRPSSFHFDLQLKPNHHVQQVSAPWPIYLTTHSDDGLRKLDLFRG